MSSQRWRDVVSERLALKAEYAEWFTALPDSLHDSPVAAALESIADLDITNLAGIDTFTTERIASPSPISAKASPALHTPATSAANGPDRSKTAAGYRAL